MKWYPESLEAFPKHVKQNKLFITYEKVRDRIVKGVRIAIGVINYTSPIHRETSEVLTLLIYSIKNHITGEGQIFY